MHRHGGPGRGKADQDSLTQAEERTHLCRNLRAQRAERRAQSALANCSLSRFGSLAQRIRSGKSAGKKFDREKLASFGPLCLSSDSTRCQESESLINFQTRRAVRPYFQLPSGTLYFRHYEVGAPCRSGHVWASKGTEQATWGLREAQELSQRPMDTSKQPFISSDMRTAPSDMRSGTLISPRQGSGL